MDTAVRRKWNLNGAAATALRRVKNGLAVLKTRGERGAVIPVQARPSGERRWREGRAASLLARRDCVLAVTAPARASRRAE